MAVPGWAVPGWAVPGLAETSPVQTARACATEDPVPATRLFITVTGARRIEGNITFTLYGARPEAFLAHKGKIALVRVKLTGTAATACFALSSPGTYAVAVYHDQNDNHEFDRTLIGLPAEGYGFSNDAPVRLGPPDFDAVRFDARPGDNRISVGLRY